MDLEVQTRVQSSNDGVNWLADKNMPPNIAERARIFTCDWPSDLFERSDLIQKEIEELARLLLDGIERRPSATNANLRGRDRPILFIASCLGGIILMKALVIADHNYLPIRKATRAIVFLATPFGDASFQDLVNWAVPGLKAWVAIRGQEVNKMLKAVEQPTFDVDELARSFTQLCRNDYLDLVMTFDETGQTNLYHKVFRYLPISSKQLVDKSSATLQMVPDPLPLDRPHITTNRF
ncbi:hypothetical protein QQS21_004811 [Conoideocrella luteorostrata]|uniref:Uncharacterized protein n=1 Tax=Conoideocrella luteorostrata TaxID=1105319 RepID=A0AAJ0CQN8_9HYPO|nr:hypothetical protein QQS21_004811 [Conoideocrella luteorostrata]